MIKIIVVMIVLIVLGIMTIIQNRKRNTRIKELEVLLNGYYKEREQTLKLRLKDKGLIE